MLKQGIFLRAAAFRRIGIYWNPGVNGGLPLIKKLTTFMKSLIWLTISDISCSWSLFSPGKIPSSINAFTLCGEWWWSLHYGPTDMIFIDALKNSGVDYDFNKRRIYPCSRIWTWMYRLELIPNTSTLFVKLFMPILFTVYVAMIPSIVHLSSKTASSLMAFANLEAFKAKYAPFFVEDFRWTEQIIIQWFRPVRFEAKNGGVPFKN